MTRDEAMMVFRDAISAGQALAPFAGEEAAATVIQQAFAERDGEMREALEGFVNSLTGSLRNLDKMLTINHDELVKLIEAARQALAAKGDSRG